MLDLGNVFILGDSYSTFEGFIPEGYDTYYSAEGGETDVRDVKQTWWHQLLEETNSHLLLNSSFSGTTICNTGYDGADYTERSFIGRLDKRINANYFAENTVDTFIIFGGTNDSWANAPIGELMYADWKKEDLFCVLPALGYLLHRVKTNIPEARVIFVLNTELKPEITENIKTACEKAGIEVVELENIDKMCGHPTIAGMKQIKEQIIACL